MDENLDYELVKILCKIFKANVKERDIVYFSLSEFKESMAEYVIDTLDGEFNELEPKNQTVEYFLKHILE